VRRRRINSKFKIPVYFSLNDLLLWLDLSNPNVLTFNGTDISNWNDKSRNQNPAVQSTAVNQPLFDTSSFGNKPALLFDGAANVMTLSSTITNSGPFSIFFVTNSNNFGAFSVIYSSTGALNFIGIQNAGKVWMACDLNPGSSNDITVDFPTGDAILYLQRDSAGKWDLSVNGGPFNRLFADAVKNAPQNWVEIGDDGIGGGLPWSGHIAEIIHYDREVTSSERINILNYLSKKYGIDL
jgi:hypothetical protein